MSVEKIEKGVVVSMKMLLTVDGEEVENTADDEVIEYLHGFDNCVPGLEAALVGKKIGDRVQVTVPPELGYGDYDEEKVVEYTHAELAGSGSIELGELVGNVDEEGYLVEEGEVVEITDDTVVVDFNDPLAGMTLNYDVEIVDLRLAEPEELELEHPHSWHDDEEEETE
jgi:FKBP-type peptidyl-prolyl cis-trans isomerase SlyD